jgi:hypothetical protein
MTLTFPAYLSNLPPHQQVMMRGLRNRIRRNLPRGYVERFDQRMLAYEIPLKTYQDTYNGQPLRLASLAAQRSYVSLYLMAVYGDPALEMWFREAYGASGKKLRMGKCCIRFREIKDIPFEVIDEAIARVPVKRYIQLYERAKQGRQTHH